MESQPVVLRIPTTFHGVFHTVIGFLGRLLEWPDQTPRDQNTLDCRKILFLSYKKRMGLQIIVKTVHCGKSTVNEFLDRFERCDRKLLS